MADDYSSVIPGDPMSNSISVSYADPGMAKEGIGLKDIAAAVPLSVIGGLDTTISSLSFGALSSTLVSDTLLDNAAGHASGLYEMYKDREDGYKMAGDIAALMVGVGAATKALRAGEYAVKGGRALGLLKTEADLGAFSGYIAGTSEAAAAATEAATVGKSAPTTLEIARAMFRARDAELVAKGGAAALEQTPARMDAMRNLYKIGATSAIGDLAAGEIAAGLMMNQSSTIYPEGMTVKDWALTTAAFGGLMVAGTVWRSRAVGMKSAKEAGLQFATKDVASPNPTMAQADDASFSLGAKFEARDAAKLAREAADVEPEVRSAANSIQAELDLRISQQFKEMAAEMTWAGGGIRLSTEMNNVMREALDSSAVQGTKGIQYSEDLIGRQRQITESALERHTKRIDEIKDIERPSIAQLDEMKRLQNEIRDIETTRFMHVNSDGVLLPEGEMPKHLGVLGPKSSYVKSVDAGQWMVTAGKETTAEAAIVQSTFQSNVKVTSQTDLVTMNKLSQAYSNMIKSPSFAVELDNAGNRIKISEMIGNDPAIDAILKHIDSLPTPTDRNLFLQKLELPQGVNNVQQLRDWEVTQKANAFMDWMREAANNNAMRKQVLETTPYEASMRFGLKLHEKDGSASPLLSALQGAAGSVSKKLPEAAYGEEGLRTLAAAQKTLGMTTNTDAMNAARNSIELRFDRIGYDFKEKPIALLRSRYERDQIQALTYRDMMNVNKMDRDEKLARSVQAAREQLGYASDEYANAGGLVQKLNELVTPDRAKLRDYIETAAAAVNQSQADMNPVVQLILSRAYQIENIAGTPVIRGYTSGVQKAMNEHIKAVFAPAVAALRELSGIENRAHQFSMNSYYAAMNLKLPVLEGFDELGRVRLDRNNPITAKIWKNITGKEFTADTPAFLPDPSRLINGDIVPLRVTDKAREAIGHITQISKDVLVSKNALRYANDGPLIVDRPHFVPYVARDNQHMAIIMDHTGTPRAQVSGTTIEGVERAAEERMIALKKLDPSSEFFHTSTKDIVKYKQAHGEGASDFVTWTEGASKGELANMLKVDDSNAYVTSLLSELQSNMRGIAVDHMRTNFKEAMNALNFNRSISDLRAATDTKSKQQMLDDAFTLFEEAVTGYRTPKPASVAARIDDASQSVIQWMEDTAAGRLVHNALTTVGGLFKRAGGKQLSEADWTAISKKLETDLGYAPFTNALQRAEAVGSYTAPRDVKEIMQKGNSVAAYLILQLAEMSQGFMNATNALAMGPAQLRLMRRMAGESEAMHQFRIGNLGGVHGDVVLPNEFGALVNGIKHLKDPEFKKYYQQYGEISHEEGKMLNMLSSTNSPPDAKSWWSRFFNSDSGWLTAPSRKGDEWGALYSHAIAHDYMKRSGLDISDPLIKAYGDNIARKIITITGPQDKADLYRTVPGIPLGLFQSFTNNYIQHLMRMVENGDARAMLTQYATQGMMFGLHSVPGWEQFNKTMFKNWDGSNDFDGQAEKSLGRGMYDMVMHGPLWSIPKIFGGDGVGIYSRGDANIRMSLGQITSPMDLPANQVRSKMIDMLVQSVRAVGGHQDAWETLVRSIPNRPIKGLAESLQGYATDRSGQMTFDRTQDWGAAFQRLMGLKTMTEIEAAKKTFDLKDVEARQRSEKAKLRAEVMADIRAGHTGNMNRWAENYVRYGGSPDQFSRWLKDAIVQATAVRYDRDIEKAMKKAKSMDDLRVLGDAMTSR